MASNYIKRLQDIADYKRHICELKAQIAMDEREIIGIELQQEIDAINQNNKNNK